MKNYLTLVLALSVVTSPAFASRARLESLGEGKNGSYYIDDARNIFLNPAVISHYKKKLMLEFGKDTAAGMGQDVAVTTDRGQGGFTNTFGDFTYGLYINNTSERALAAVTGANALLASSFISPDSQLEFTFAGEGSMNWGLSAIYAGNETKASGLGKTASLLGARLGVEMGQLAVFSTVGIASSSKIKNATNDEIKGKLAIDAAATYKMDQMTSFAKYSTWGSDFSVGGTTIENRNTMFGLGAGWKKDMTKMTNLFMRLEADYQKTTTQTQADTKYYNVPMTVGAEAAALNWLTIRGSVATSLIGQMDAGPTRSSLAGTTTVSAGVGMTFGDVQVDGLVATTGGNANNSNTVGGAPGFGTAPQTDSTFGFGNNMISRVAMTYNF